jgi:uncharacterized membrane protein
LNLIRVMPAKGQDIMNTSIFLARLIGPLLLAVGAGILIDQKPFRTIAGEVVRSVTLVYLFGLFDFVAGLAIVLTHNVWAANWRVLITLLGWLMLIRGAARILAPETIMGYAAKIMRNKQVIPISGVVIGLLGLVLCYFGYTT